MGELGNWGSSVGGSVGWGSITDWTSDLSDSWGLKDSSKKQVNN
jgi:hypothetical protein